MPRRYFYDTEFIEYPHTIDLISIGMVSDQGTEYYAINSECNFSKASAWVKENVIAKLPPRSSIWKSRQQIANDVIEFIKPAVKSGVELWGYVSAYDYVALCWLFGPMINLPNGMPIFTRDIQQLAWHLGNPQLPPQPKKQHDALEDARWVRAAYKFLDTYAAMYRYPIRV